MRCSSTTASAALPVRLSQRCMCYFDLPYMLQACWRDCPAVQ